MKSRSKSISYLKNKADELFSLYIRTRDKKCLYCSSTQNLQCAHIKGRRNERLRFDPNNAITLCLRHHLYWAHKEPRDFAHWVEETFPDKCAYIDAHWQETKHRKLGEYQELVDNLRSLISELEK